MAGYSALRPTILLTKGFPPALDVSALAPSHTVPCVWPAAGAAAVCFPVCPCWDYGYCSIQSCSWYFQQKKLPPLAVCLRISVSAMLAQRGCVRVRQAGVMVVLYRLAELLKW